MDSQNPSNDIGTMDKPIMEFRPQLFPHLDSNRPILNIGEFSIKSYRNF